MGLSQAVIVYSHLGYVLRRFLGDGFRYGMELIFRLSFDYLRAWLKD
jgi:hypothetical protein